MTKLRLAQRVSQLPEYVFAELTRTVKEVENTSRRKVLNLGVGSPDIAPSSKYVDFLVEAIKQPNAHAYPGYQAIPELSEALIAWYQKRFSVKLDREEILPLLGAKDGVSHIPLVVLDEGDEILVPNPGYPAYFTPSLFVNATPVSYDLLAENDFGVSIDNLESKVTSKTKCIWVNFPSNPTGRVATLEELKTIVSFCQKHNLILLYDNAYAEITFDGVIAPSILEIPAARDLAVEIQSFSKTYSFAGYRMGWMVGSKEIISSFAKIKSQLDSGMPIPLQKLGAFALTHQDTVWQEAMLRSYRERRDIIAEKLTKLGLTFALPQGTLYIWARIPDSAKNSSEFSLNLLREKHILLTPGAAFGDNGDRYVRVSICSNIDKIDDYV